MQFIWRKAADFQNVTSMLLKPRETGQNGIIGLSSEDSTLLKPCALRTAVTQFPGQWHAQQKGRYVKNSSEGRELLPVTQ